MLGIGDELVRQWYHHGLHGAAFRIFYDMLTEQYGTLADFNKQQKQDASSTTPATTPNNKRIATSPVSSQPKRLKLDIDKHVLADVADVKGDELQQA
jgi:hypothetical protein